MSFRIAPHTPLFEKGRRRRRIRPLGEGQRQPRAHDRAHLRCVAQLPCLISGAPGPSEAAHVRYGSVAHGKHHTGMQEKPDDRWTVPLCAELHRLADCAQHNHGERQWWAFFGVDPLLVARELHECTGDLQAMEEVISRHTPSEKSR